MISLLLVKNFNMKNNLIIALLLVSGFIKAQVGIGTEEPTRTLDVNGNLRVTRTVDKTNSVDYGFLLAADTNSNNIDKISIPAIIDDGMRQVEIVKNIYNSTTADVSKITSCGKLEFRLNPVNTSTSTTEVRFRENVFLDYTLTTLSLKFGGKRWGRTSETILADYSYRNLTITFNPSNWNTFQNIDTTFLLRQGAYLNYHFIIPQDGDLYRLTVSRLKNNATLDNFSLICERFYKAI